MTMKASWVAVAVIAAFGLGLASSPIRIARAATPDCFVDPETKVFTEIRKKLIADVERKKGLDRNLDQGFVVLLDKIEISHNEIVQHNREKPNEKPEADVLDIRKELFGK